MDKEIDVLNYLMDNEDATQRDIATNTGLSLGAVNVLLKKMVHKGLIKMEHLTTRTVRYILTPEGMKEKAKKTYRYVVRTYREIIRIRKMIINVVHKIMEEKKVEAIYFYGKQDEIAEIINSVVKEEHLNQCSIIHDLEEINDQNNSVIVLWDPDDERELMEKLQHTGVSGILKLW